MITASIRQVVRLRASDRCEYRLLRRDDSFLPHQVEHIIAKQHGGSGELANLALACHRCNLHKGPNISGLNPLNQNLVRLFNPRRDLWLEHFEFQGPQIVGLTSICRTSFVVLAMNEDGQLDKRTQIIDADEFLL